MKQEDELALKVAKEIVLKFIETGRLSINSFDEAFRNIHRTVYLSLIEQRCQVEDEDGEIAT